MAESESRFLHGAGMWSCCAEAPDGSIYCLPGNARRILRFTDELELWGPDLGEETWKWTVAILGSDGSIWGIPGNETRVLCITADGRVEFVGPPLEGQQKWHAALLAPDGCIYAPPCDAGQVLRIDCANHAVSLIGPVMGGVGKYCSCALADGYIYCPPNHAAQVLRIAVGSRRFQLVDTIGPDLRFGGGGGYVCCATSSDGRSVYCPPFSARHTICICDGRVELVGETPETMAHQWRSALRARDGCIYAIPCNASRVLKVDQQGVLRLVGPEWPSAPAPEGLEKWRGGVELGDSIYGIPSHAKQILRIKTGDEALSSPSFEQLQAEQQRAELDAEKNLKPVEGQEAPSSMEEEEEDFDSEIEDVEDWPLEECDGVSLWGPVLGQKWTRKNKWRSVLAGRGQCCAPPYYCGQMLYVDTSRPEEEAVQLLGEAPPKPPKKVFVPLPDEE
ncbi:unnamed protein product [Durusdinium trenchii]|uniref:Uncharacterized protein n=2 Tax=Durusdinium trenchii TaxID=1381693 RepID=A0ABP0N3Q4_9DINO